MNIVQKSEIIKTIDRSISQQSTNIPFYLVLLYLFLEFGRPQEGIPGFDVLHIPAIVTILLALSLFFSGKLILSDKQTKLFIFFLALMVPHIPLAVNNYWAFHVARGMFITFIVYLGIITFVNSFQRFKNLIYIWLGIHVYLSITGIIKGGHGIGGFLGDENDFCMTLNMIIPFAFFMALSEENKFKKIIYFSLIALFLLANILTLSRGGFIGLIVVGIYCWLRSPKKIVSVVLIGLLTLFIFQYTPDKYWEEIKTIQQGTSAPTAEERIYQWKIGWNMFLDNPVLGVGQGNFPFQFRKYEIASGFYEGLHGRSRAGRAAHSLYFTLLPELGLIGTLIFLLMLYSIYKDLRMICQIRDMRHPSILGDKDINRIFYFGLAMEASLVGYLISGIFISILYYPNFWLLMGFVVALKKAVYREYENHSPSH